MKIGRPVSQHRPLPDVGGPEVAEHGDVLRAPGGTVVVTAMATGAAGGEDGAEGAEGVVLWVVGDPRKGKCDMVFSPPGMLDRRSLFVTVSIIHSAVLLLLSDGNGFRLLFFFFLGSQHLTNYDTTLLVVC